MPRSIAPAQEVRHAISPGKAGALSRGARPPGRRPSLRTPGLDRYDRVLIAATARRDERTVAAWWRGEHVPPACAETIEAVAEALGIRRPCA